MEQVGWSDIAHNIASVGCHNLDDRHTTSIYHESVRPAIQVIFPSRASSLLHHGEYWFISSGSRWE
jgi:hypothetical protein